MFIKVQGDISEPNHLGCAKGANRANGPQAMRQGPLTNYASNEATRQNQVGSPRNHTV